MHQVKILNQFILEGNISVIASFKDHCAIVDMLHPTFFCQINELAEHNSSLDQSSVYRLFILLIVLENRTFYNFHIVNLEDLFNIF